jgi:ribosomal protein S18 acetylase RimI-like enzyme
MIMLEKNIPVLREPAKVRAADAAEREAVLGVIVRAFEADPVVRWWFPDRGRHAATFGAFAAVFGGGAFDHRSAYVAPTDAGDGCRAAALWLPPGVGPDEAKLVDLLEREVPADRIGRVLEMLVRMGSHHPSEPHWYLPLIGTDPSCQGCGHGSALLRDAADRLDAAGSVAHLESTHPRNVPLYERYGFEVVGRIELEDVPPVIPMVRRPR